MHFPNAARFGQGDSSRLPLNGEDPDEGERPKGGRKNEAGLDLALVKSIVDLHGGSAKIESEVDRGTTVTLVFPNMRAA
jgi:signal transduction histidine kinase